MKADFIFDEGSSKEDTYLIGENIFGVFDGANSSTKFFDEGGRGGGLIAASIIRDTFLGNKGALKDLAIESNSMIMKKMVEENIDLSNKLNLWCSQAAVIRVNADSFEWMQIGDSLILIIHRDGSFRLPVNDYDHDKEELLLLKEYGQEKRTGLTKLIKNELDERRKRSNIDYGVLNGEAEAEKFINHGTETLDGVAHVILFTDGLIIPKESPEDKDDFDTFVRLFLEGGLENIKKYVRNLEKDDSECWKYPRFKQYDDIAAISVSF